MPPFFAVVSIASAVFAAGVEAQRSWGGYGDTTFGNWAIDDVTQTATYNFRGGSCSGRSAPLNAASTCVALENRTAVHVVANDRHQVFLFSDGSAALRQDEGGPKLLNTYNASLPGGPQFGGAAGFVTNVGTNGARLLAATVVDAVVSPTAPVPLTLVLGAGFARKEVTPAGEVSKVSASLVAPFGDDSVVLSIVEITGTPGSSGAYTEVWAATRLQFNVAGTQAPLRHSFSLVNDTSGNSVGILDTPAAIASFKGSRAASRHSFTSPSLPKPSIDDPSPRAAFFVCLSCASGAAPLSSLTTSSSEVYGSGSGGPAQPDVGALARGLSNSTVESSEGACLSALQVRYTIPASGSVVIAFMYGYVQVQKAWGGSVGSSANTSRISHDYLPLFQPQEDGDIRAAVDSRVQRYSAAWPTAIVDAADAWAAEGSVLAPDAVLSLADLISGGAAAAQELRRAASTSWEARESRWHAYMLRCGLTFDSYYGNHILNQNGNYLFVSGQQAAARDPLAYAMPLSLDGPAAAGFVVEVVNYTLMSKLTAPLGPQPAGAIPWGRQAYGEDASGSFHASDLELAMLYTLGFHVVSTRDTQVLTAPLPWNGSWTTVGEAAWESFLRLRDGIGVGPHNLVYLRLSDHNDGLLGNLGIYGSNETTAVTYGESVMNSAFGAYVLQFYADALELLGGASDRVAAVQAFARVLLGGVAAQWAAAPLPMRATSDATHGWFRRVYLGTDVLGWRGDPSVDGVMWTETQAWALLAGAADSLNVTSILLESLAALAQDPSPVGAINAGPVIMNDDGNGYGGIWYCGNLALIAALGLRGPPVSAALKEWRKNALASHAHAYPDIWFGATSGPDVYDSVLSATPGSTRCAWAGPGVVNPCNEASVPVLNLWSHTLPTFSLPGIVGFTPTAAGISLRAGATADGRLSVYTPLVSLVRDNVTAACNVSGHYAPHTPPGTRVEIAVQLAAADAAACSAVVVNGGSVAFVVQPGGTLVFNATTVAVGRHRSTKASGGSGLGVAAAPTSSLALWQLS